VAQNRLPGAQGPAASTSGVPDELVEVAIEQRLDEPIPLELVFRDESGRQVTLGDYFGDKPVILTLVYYECPMLCTLILNGLITGLREVSFDIGEQFDVVTVSIDPDETPELALDKKKTHLEQYGREGAGKGWHFLTGEKESIEALAAAVGFKYLYDPLSDEFAHASAIMVVTPEGRLARYFYGVDYPSRDLRFALMEASENRIGSLADQLILYCYQYDPETGTYAAATFFIMRTGAILTVLILGTAIYLFRRREHRLARGQEA
jgi:protein SCO1/2